MATENQKKADQPKSSTADAGEGQVQETVDRESDQGYRGVVADPTPNSAYTVSGVVAGEPTPETHEAQADKAAARARELGRRLGPTERGEES